MFCNQHSWWQKQWVKHVWFVWLFHLRNELFSLFTPTDFSPLPDNIKDYISTLQSENTRYSNELQSLQTQLSDLTAVVDFADSTRIAEITDLKQRHQQELATIQILMEGRRIFSLVSSHVVFSSFVETIRDRVGDARGKYENDVTNLRRKCELLQQENYDLKTRALDEK